jgi:hypothetical protein
MDAYDGDIHAVYLATQICSRISPLNYAEGRDVSLNSDCNGIV